MHDTTQSICNARSFIVDPGRVTDENNIDRTNQVLLPLHSVRETHASSFLLSFNKKDNVAFQSPTSKKLRHSASGNEDRALIISSSASIIVSIMTC